MILFHVPQDILTENNAHIHHHPDSNRDAGEGHYVGVDTHELHNSESQENRQRQNRGDQRGAGNVVHHDDHDDDGDQYFFRERFF